MRGVTLVVPGSLRARTGGSIYDRRLAEGLQALGWMVSVVELEPFVHPLAPPLHSAPAQFAAIPDDSVVLVDGLGFGTMPEIIENEAWRLHFLPIVHMVLSTTPGLTRGEAAWLSNLERRALARARHIVVTGARTKMLVSVMTGAIEAPITRIPPGVDSVLTVRADDPTAPVRMVCVANLTWGKGHDILLQSLAALPGSGWTLTCVGSAERNPRHAAWIRQMAVNLGVDARITWAGESHRSLSAELRQADLFVLPTRSETYGMAVAEAIAHGVPVVSTRTGEIPSIVGDGGLLAEPGDRDAFAAILRKAVGDSGLRRQLAAGARTAAARLPTWESAARTMDTLLASVVTRG